MGPPLRTHPQSASTSRGPRTTHRPAADRPGPPPTMKLACLAAAALLAPVTLAPALLSFDSSSAPGLGPQLADAPPGQLPFQAGALTGIDDYVLLAGGKVETGWRRAREGQPDEPVPADVRADVDTATLQPMGATAQLLGRPTAGASATG